MKTGQTLSDLLRTQHEDILKQWVGFQLESLASRPDLVSADQLRRQSQELFNSFSSAIRAGGLDNMASASWDPVRAALRDVAAERARQGFSSTETATFVMSLKQPLFGMLRDHGSKGEDLERETWNVNNALDQLALFTMETYQKSREDVIARQRLEMMELSTPVVSLWSGVLALPLIGTLDSERTQTVMENLLQRIVDTGSTIAILDITGVPTVDTLVAQHLLKTVAAARLMGADCIISGIRPQIAQTIVHLGIELSTVTTKATLSEAFAVALERLGLTVIRRGGSES